MMKAISLTAGLALRYACETHLNGGPEPEKTGMVWLQPRLFKRLRAGISKNSFYL
jgi:hypothetical protein